MSRSCRLGLCARRARLASGVSSRPRSPECSTRGFRAIGSPTCSDVGRRTFSPLDPQLVSIKIGINDVWHGLTGGEGTSIEKFQETYADILGRLKAACPETTIVLCEPSVIWPPAPAEGNELLKPYVEAVRDAAADFNVRAIVPLHRSFRKSRIGKAGYRMDTRWRASVLLGPHVDRPVLARLSGTALDLPCASSVSCSCHSPWRSSRRPPTL